MASVEDVTAGRDRLLTAQEVADRFRVNIETVANWGRKGKLSSARTGGGHRRYFKSEVDAILRGEVTP